MTHDMERTRLIPFDVEHLACMDLRDVELRNFFQLDDAIPRLDSMKEIGAAWTMIHDGRVLCCGGVVPMMPGTATAWIVPSIWVNDYPRVFAKVVRERLDQLMEDMNLHRMETVCLQDELHTRWMGWLGFEKEGVRRQYDAQKNDYIQWARLRNGN